jgi:hypothetical protein
MKMLLLKLGGVGLLAAACGSTAMPPPSMTEAQSSVRAAEAVGAESLPRGALHLKLARDGIEDAKRLIADDESEKAELVLERAEVDAELALALTHEAKARAEAQTALAEVRELDGTN